MSHHEWSHYQQAIFEAFEHSQDSLLIEAVAGSGKTTVLVELARIMQRVFTHQRGVFLAFNKSIAMELQARIDAAAVTRPMSMVDKLRRASEADMEPQAGRLFERVRPNVQAMTLHSAGWAAWRRAGGLDWEPRVDSGKVSGIMREVLTWEESKRWGETTRRLVGYAKGIGLVPRVLPNSMMHDKHDYGLVYNGLAEDEAETWEQLIDHYGLDEAECNIPLVRKVLARSIELARETCDFDDMLYVPIISGVPFDQYDVVLVDEAQDVSGIQMEMMQRMVKPSGRVVAVGDRKQSIYGFRGAGTESMDIMQTRFGMRELPLSVSYRCPRAVVEWSRQWVRQIEHREDAEDGYVGLEGTDWAGQGEIALGAPVHDDICPLASIPPKVLADPDLIRIKPTLMCECYKSQALQGITKWRGIADFHPGDAVLCRLTRPLVAAAFSLIRARIPAHVLGRDIGKGLTDLIKRSKMGTVRELLDWLDGYQVREGARLRRRQKFAQAGLLDDRCETLRVFCAELPEDATTAELTREVEGLFADANGGMAGMVTLATVHKAKGLEWQRVFVLDAGELMPVPWGRGDGWEREQEWNICYVAATRAKRELRYIRSSDLRS